MERTADGRLAPAASPCAGHCDCVPTAPGYYFARHRKWRWREVVKVERNGHGHVRAYVHRMSGSFGLEEFTDYAGPLMDPLASAQTEAKG